jgi:DNA-binding GntR family transcriptional regulator
MVAPLSAEELRGICQLRRRIEPQLAARACALTTPDDLDVLEAGVELAQDPGSSVDERFDAHHTLLLDLLRPAAASWDLRTLQMLWRATERYLRVGFDQPDRTAADAASLGRAQRELIAGYRSRDPDAARAATVRHVDWSERVADRGFGASPPRAKPTSGPSGGPAGASGGRPGRVL